MKLHRIIILSFVLLLCSSSFISAQEIEKSKKTELIGQKTYYIHTVRQGQSIYGIAKAYSVGLNEIYAVNPELKNNVQIGVIIKVPQIKYADTISGINHTVEKGETLYKIATNYYLKVPEVLAANPGLTEAIKPGQVIIIPLQVKKPTEPFVETSIHIVQKGETLFNIAAKYETTVAELKKLNPSLSDILSLGQQIKIPFQKNLGDAVKKVELQPKKDSVIVFECGKTGKQDSYNIAVMIPLYLGHSFEIDTGDLKTPANTYKSFTFLQFYEGIRMALDSLEGLGFSAKVYVYDVTEDTTPTDALLKKPEFAGLNLIIGPLFSNNFRIVAQWAENHKVAVINPFTNKSDIIDENPYAFKLIPSPQNEARQIINFIESNYAEANVIIVHNDKEQALADSLKHLFDAFEAKNEGKIKIKEIDYPSEGYAGVSKCLSDTKLNIVVTLIDGEAFVSTFLRNLNEMAYTDKILLLGRKNWEDYNNLEVEYLMNLNTHVYSNSFIDYSNPEIRNLVTNFRSKYKTDPDYYAFQGFDIMMYFAGALKEYGKNFTGCLHLYKPTLLCNSFNFSKSKYWGFENNTGVIYRYENYKAINAINNPLKEIMVVEKKKP